MSQPACMQTIGLLLSKKYKAITTWHTPVGFLRHNFQLFENNAARRQPLLTSFKNADNSDCINYPRGLWVFLEYTLTPASKQPLLAIIASWVLSYTQAIILITACSQILGIEDVCDVWLHVSLICTHRLFAEHWRKLSQFVTGCADNVEAVISGIGGNEYIESSM